MLAPFLALSAPKIKLQPPLGEALWTLLCSPWLSAMFSLRSTTILTELMLFIK